MTDILLIRHGETDWNAVRRMQGHSDVGLNENGRQQARALGAALAGERIDAIYSSDLARARDTAQAIADRHGLAVREDARLRERCYGGFEGSTHDEIRARHPEAFAQWRAREPHARFPAGERKAETLHEFSLRAVEAVVELACGHPDGRIVIVAHGGVLDCLYRAANGLGLQAARDFDMKNASINRLHWSEGGLQVRQWSQVDHLDVALDEVDR